MFAGQPWILDQALDIQSPEPTYVAQTISIGTMEIYEFGQGLTVWCFFGSRQACEPDLHPAPTQFQRRSDSAGCRTTVAILGILAG